MRHTHIRTGRGVTYSSSSSGKGVWRYLIYKDVEQTSLTSLAYLYTRLSGASRCKTQNTLNATTLSSIFDLHKEELAQKLMTYSLPRDSKEVQRTVSDFLNNMFESDGTYRQSLTQSEDYILQSAIQLLRAQQNIAVEIVSMSSEFNASPQTVTQPQVNPYVSLVGTGVGAVAGGMLGTWGAICGAIAGTAIVVYLAIKPKKSANTAVRQQPVTINVNAFVNIIKKICESIDNLMETYRIQVKRIQNSYEQREEVSLQNTYSMLLDQIANTVKTANSSTETPAKVMSAVNMLADTLENYGLKYENGRIVSER